MVRFRIAILGFLVLAGSLSLFSFVPFLGAQELEPRPPSLEHLLGTAQFDEDVLRWTLSGAGYTLTQVLIGLAGAFFIGVSLSCMSALKYQGWLDSIIIGIAETLRSFPGVLLVLLFAAMGISTAVALAGIYWLAFWRVLRVQLHQEMNKGYYLSSLSLGSSTGRSLVIHLVPNVLRKNIALIVSVLAEMMTAECALEFLGLGPALDVPSLGRQVFWALDYSFDYAWTWLPAAVVIVLAVAALQLVANVLSSNRDRARTVNTGEGSKSDG